MFTVAEKNLYLTSTPGKTARHGRATRIQALVDLLIRRKAVCTDSHPLWRFHRPRHPRHAGYEDLMDVVEKLKPKIHAFGHIHEDYGVLNQNEIIFINAYNLDGHYRVKHTPIEIKI